jgi:hypothetical protein
MLSVASATVVDSSATTLYGFLISKLSIDYGVSSILFLSIETLVSSFLFTETFVNSFLSIETFRRSDL